MRKSLFPLFPLTLKFFSFMLPKYYLKYCISMSNKFVLQNNGNVSGKVIFFSCLGDHAVTTSFNSFLRYHCYHKNMYLIDIQCFIYILLMCLTFNTSLGTVLL